MTERTEQRPDQPDVDVPDDEAEVSRQVEADRAEELTGREKNLAVAQAKSIGDL